MVKPMEKLVPGMKSLGRVLKRLPQKRTSGRIRTGLPSFVCIGCV